MDPLRREVMAPRRPVGLLGPLFVLGSTLSLALAMAAMTLTPRPHHRGHGMHGHGHGYRAAAAAERAHRAHVQAQRQAAARPAAAEVDGRCGAPVYHANADGSYDATFEVCTDAPPPRRHRR